MPKPAIAKKRTRACTITFAPAGENAVGAEIIGDKDAPGFSLSDMERIYEDEQHRGTQPVIYHLNTLAGVGGEAAQILLIRDGLDDVMGETGRSDELEEWLASDACIKQTRKKSHGRIVNSLARTNTLFYDGPQTVPSEEEMMEGASYKMNFSSCSDLKHLRRQVENMTGREMAVAELNHYPDVDQNVSGIGYHGDSERKLVVMARLGKGSVEMPLKFQAFHRGKAIGKTISVVLRHGDMLLMSEKATGHDWKRSSIITWRHAAGKKAAWNAKKHGPEPKMVLIDA